jgi:hypothetical protein
MIPGTTSKVSETTVASAATIFAKSDVVKVTGTTQIDTILGNTGGFGQFLVLIPVDGSVILSTAGNILIGITAVVNRAVFMVFLKSTGKWYINSGV